MLLLAILLQSILSTGSLADVHLFVSPGGSDSFDGFTTGRPIKTLEKAAARLHDDDVRGSSVFIELMKGYHDVTKTISLTEDFRHPITFRAYNHEEVHITGGRRVRNEAFHSVTDSKVLQQIPAVSHHKVKQLKLSDVGISREQLGKITKFGFLTPRVTGLEVFYNGVALNLARYPNREDSIPIVSTVHGKTGHAFTYPTSLRSRAEKWQHEPDLWAYGFWYVSWCDETAHISHVEPTNNTITLDSILTHGMRTGGTVDWKNGQHRTLAGYFSVFNALSELDQEGEYYIDRETGILYIWPPEHSGAIINQDVIYVSVIDTIFELNGLSSVTFEDLILEGCRFTAIHGNYLHSSTFQRLEVKNTGYYGMVIERSDGITVRQCDIHDTDGGLVLNGGDRRLLTPSRNLIENNHIWNFSRAAAFNTHGINVGGVQTVVQFNDIYNGRYTGIWWTGNNHLIRKNHVHHLCTGSTDCGGIHSGRDWTWRGNVIKENYIHHVVKNFPESYVRGIMLDDQYSSVTIENNVFYENDIHINIGGGRDNIIRQNVFYKALSYGIALDGRGLSPTDGNRDSLYRRLNGTPVASPVWSQRYPKLATIYQNKPDEPMGNQIYENIFHHDGQSTNVYHYGNLINRRDYFNIHNNYLYAAEGDFNELKTGDYRLVCESAAWAKKHNIPQLPTQNEVGPHLPYGPSFKHETPLFGTNGPLRTHCVSTTVQPSTGIPRSAFINDGSAPNTMTESVGCWFIIDGCPKETSIVGKHRDAYGELHDNAANDEKSCLGRAAVQWRACGSPTEFTVTAVYGPTGATTIAGEGCFMASYGCPKHGHPNEGQITRDGWAEEHVNGAHNETNCLERAMGTWTFCGSHKDFPIVSNYRPNASLRVAGYGCWIHVTKCPKDPKIKSTFFDAWGESNANTGVDQESCFQRAIFYWEHCGSDRAHSVTANFRPKSSFKKVP